MTVEIQTARVVYAGNNSTTEWPITFELSYANAAALKVAIVNTSTGEVTELSSGYTVSIPNMEVTYPVVGNPLGSDYNIVLWRETAPTQTLDLSAQSTINKTNLEDAYDKVTRMIQEDRENLARCVMFPIDETPTDDERTSYLEDIQASEAAASAAATAAGISETAAAASEAAAAASASAAAASEAAALASQVAAAASESAAAASEAAAEVFADSLLINTHEETATAGQTYVDVAFTLAQSISNIAVEINGVVQAPSTLTRTSDSRLTLGGALTGGEKIVIRNSRFSPAAATDAAASAIAAETSATAAAASALAAEEAAAAAASGKGFASGGILTVSTNYSILTSDLGKVLLVDTSAARTLSLPDPAAAESGFMFTLKDWVGSADSFPITISRYGSEKIENLAANYVCEEPFGEWSFITNGTDWFIFTR
jgi:hypothetical protein